MSKLSVAEILSEAGIEKNDPDYGIEFNLCHAAMFDGLGVRAGSSQAVKDCLAKHDLVAKDLEVLPETQK